MSYTMLIVVRRNLRGIAVSPMNKAPASLPQAQEREFLETPDIMPNPHSSLFFCPCLPGHADHLPLRHGHCLRPRW